MRAPAAAGQAAIVSQRGLVLNLTSLAQTTNILTIANQTSTAVTRVDLDFVVEQAFNGAGASLTVQRIKADGTTSTVLTGTFAAGDNVKKTVLSTDGDQYNVIYNPGAGATTGLGAVYARATGNGQLVG